MPTTADTETIFDRGWVYRIRQPQDRPGTHLTLLLHGWTGDETVMWVFAHNLPRNRWLIAPRGPVPGSPTGYGWSPVGGIHRQQYAQYSQSGRKLMDQVQLWKRTYHIPDQPIDLIGFSQGASLAYTLLLDYPEQIGKTAALAGFLPDQAAEHMDITRLRGKEIFIAHGSEDRTVPVVLARDAARLFGEAGATVQFCEDQVGHKLGISCHKNLERFFAD